MLPEYKFCISSLRYWNRLINMDHDRLTRIIFEWDFQLLNSGSWCGNIENIFEMLNLWESFANGTEVNLCLAKNKLIDTMNTEWANKLPYKPKLRVYSTFKNNIETEDFLKSFLPKCQRSLFTQLRIGILPLAIETGRYTRTNLENRFCLMCKENFIEDEIHFLCQCSAYDAIRNKYSTALTRSIPDFQNMDPFEQFFNIQSCGDQKLMVKFVNEMWLFRKNNLFT